MIATLSKGNDEIFNKDYFPSAADRRKVPIMRPTLTFNDGLF